MNLKARALLVSAAVATLLVSGSATAQAGPRGTTSTPQLTVFATGLNQPRHLIAVGNQVVVAEAGTGGNLQCVGTKCLGRTGSVAYVTSGQVQRIVQNLPSLGNAADGAYGVGPADIALSSNGTPAVLMSNLASGVNPVTGANPFGANGPEMGRLLTFTLPSTTPQLGADFGVYEVTNNPDGGAGAPTGAEKESNPYGMTAYGDGFAVVDTGANSLLWVRTNGTVQTLAALPTKTIGGQVVQSAPTAVEVGPDGALYVAELSPSGTGTARVYRVVPGQAPTVYADGFTLLIDLAFDTQGRLLTLSMAQNGAFFPPSQGEVVRVEKNGTKTRWAPTGLIAPSGIAVSGNKAYISNKGVASPGGGEIVRLTLP
ncbi:ScyD/ScyE family protein [Micromonospora sp. WMMA1923]|uniref:ScyD/ScyE family protein n=1 Tax=Micromonospora sp. WMMA1923 TaxID=3404125 RepID=UPI003B92325A